jgi:23S rRNA (cytidine1920-2'-O)/16S rRNA (cytidine1409-2'-O)-methyltransferase
LVRLFCMTKIRADLLLVSRGFLPTRAKAREAIEAGLVKASGRVIKKPADLLDPDCQLTAERAHPWASRAGLKLVEALERFNVVATGRHCLDIGASTGGFTQVLLARGAAHVVSVDVGRDQLDISLRGNPKITSLEGKDARTLSLSDLGEPVPDLVVMDVSFIGIEKILPHLLLILPSAFDLIALVKPQFQAGPKRVGKRGIVDQDIAIQVAGEVRDQIAALDGLQVLDMIDSPIIGGDGNREFLLHATRTLS